MSSMNQSVKDRFWDLDGKIRAIQTRLKPLEKERNDLAPAEASLRKRVAGIKDRRQKIIETSGLQDMAKERGNCAAFLKGKTGPRP